MAMAVVTATATPAAVRPRAGSRNAIWCTRKPACEMMAERERHRDAPERAAAQRRPRSMRPRRRAAALRPSRGGSWAAARSALQRERHGQKRGSAPAPASIAAVNPAAPASNTSPGTIDHAAKARAVEREADGKPAPRVEPQPEDVVDGAEAHGGPAEGHHQVGGKQLPGLGDERQGRRRGRKEKAPTSTKARVPSQRMASLTNTTSNALNR